MKTAFVCSLTRVHAVSRHQVTRIVLLWVNNHFNDFEGDQAMTRFLEDFEKHLEVTVSPEKEFAPCFLSNVALERKKPLSQTCLQPESLSESETDEADFVFMVDAVM